MEQDEKNANKTLILEEIEALQSLYSAEEIDVDPSDLSALLEWQDGSHLLPEVNLSIKLCSSNDDDYVLEVHTILALTYPTQPPYMRASVSKAQLDSGTLNSELQEFLQERSGLSVVYEATCWLQDRVSEMLEALPASSPSLQDDSSSTQLCREYIYFHHIYNKHKRRDILRWSAELRLSGFSVIGKPGLVCAEGEESAVKELVTRLRRLPWQKMQTKSHVCLPADGAGSTRVYPPLAELALPAHGTRGNHAAMGKVREFMSAHGEDSVFAAIFGLEELENDP